MTRAQDAGGGAIRSDHGGLRRERAARDPVVPSDTAPLNRVADDPGGEGAGADGRPDLHDLWRDHARLVFGYLAARVGRQNAEDLTSEVFVRAAKALPRYEERGVPVRAWLLVITRNLVAESYRRREPIPEDFETVQERPAAAPDPGDEVGRREEVARAKSLLKRLAPAQQEVIDLRFLRELSVAETAQVLESTEEAVRALTYRALKALRREYGAPAPDEA